MEEIPVKYPASPADQIQRDGSKGGRGFDEQWQKELEKAFFEAQVAAMHSTGGAGAEVHSENVRAEVQTHIPHLQYPMSMPVQKHTVAHQRQVAFQGKIQSSGLTEAIQEKASPGVLKTTQGILIDKTPLKASPKSAGAVEKASHLEIALVKQGEVPSKSCVKALITSQGVHIVIRNTELDASGVQRLLQRVREIARKINLHLTAVTVNGKKIWEHRHDAVIQEMVPLQNEIDQLY